MKQYKLNMNTTRVIQPIDPPSRRKSTPRSMLPRNPLTGLPAYVRRNRSKYVPDGLNRHVKQAARNSGMAI